MKRTPDQLPDPWMFDSESLLRELDRCRELVLQIPATTHEVYFAANVAIDALWNLRYTLSFLLKLHTQGQSAWAKKHHELQRSLQETPIQGAAGMEKRRKVREFQNRIANLQEQLALLQREMAQDAPVTPAQPKAVRIRA